MRIFFLILFFAVVTGSFAQQDTASRFHTIFGCSCCADTIVHPSDKNRTFILTEDKTQITARRSGKEKWTRSVFMFGDRNVWVTCMELRVTKKMYFLRVYINDKEYFDLNPKNGKTIAIKDAYRPDR